MTDTTNVLPLRPANQADADPLVRPDVPPDPPEARPIAEARVRVRGREAKEARRLPQIKWAAAWTRLQLLFVGASLVEARPPALLAVWGRHDQAARAFSKWVRVPRWAWGVVHTWVLAPALRFTEWALDSPAKALATSVVIVTTLMWFHVVSF